MQPGPFFVCRCLTSTSGAILGSLTALNMWREASRLEGRDLMQALTPQERLGMGRSMIEASRNMTLAAIQQAQKIIAWMNQRSSL